MARRFLAALLLGAFALGAGSLAAQEPNDALQSKLDFANGLFVRGFFSEATEEYEAYLAALAGQTAPPEVLYHLGEAAYAAGSHERALAAFEQLQALPGDSPFKDRARLSQGEVYYFMKAYDKAVDVLGPLAMDGADEARGRALYFLGKALFDSGKTAEAVTQLKQLIEGLPGHAMAPYAEFQLAYAYASQKDFENAAIHYSAVAGSKADEALRMESRFRAAQTYDQIGWYSAALGAYELLEKDFPESPFREQAGVGHIWALYHESKCPEALERIKTHLKAFPESKQRVELDYIRANCLQQGGDNDGALQAFTQIRESFPESEFAGRALYKMAWIQFQKGDSGTAQTLVTQFLQDYKGSDLSGEGAFLLGTILVAQGSFESAHQEFRLVAEQYPQSEFGAEALFKSGECLEQLAMSGEAAQVFEQFATQFPEHPLLGQALLRAGDARFASGAFDAAASLYARILEGAPVPLVEEQALYRLAVTRNNLKDYAGGIATLSTLLEKYPQSAYREEALFRVAEHTLKVAGEAVKAVELYQALIDAAPEGPFAGKALLGMALARYEHKDYDQAADLFLKIMEEQAGAGLNEETFNWTGQWYFDNKKWKAAAQAFEALLKAIPAYPYGDQVRLKIAECSEQAGDLEQALTQYGAVAEASATTAISTEARWHMARIYEAQGELEKAFEWYEAAANSNSGDIAARARFQLGALHEKQEDWDKAARSFMGVAILFLHEEMSPEALWRAGQCYEKAGHPDQARKAYAELTEDFPESAFAQKAGDALKALGKA